MNEFIIQAMKKGLLLVILSLGVGGQEVRAQSTASTEQELDLLFSPLLEHHLGHGVASDRRPSDIAGSDIGARGGALGLPFFDDFSTPSIPGFVPEGMESFVRWEQGSSRMTQTFALNAPTIGQATLDGLNRHGYPYSFVDVNTPDWADTLTSLPIALNGYFPESNVHLMFYYQGGGRGNAPEPGQDKLILEFKSTDDVTEEVFWTEVWSSDSASTDQFERVFVPVDALPYLVNDFQFRFRNYGALAGNVDLWHLDYILLDDQIDPAVFEIASEVAIVEPINTILREYTRMPWNHFSANPAYYMRDSVTVHQRNLSTTQSDNIEAGFSVGYGTDVTDYPNVFQNTNVLPNTTFTTTIYIGNNPQGEDYAFDTNVNDSCAIFDVGVWQSSIGLLHTEKVGVPDNDSIAFQQVFTNDFAYDDGTAEKAYALTAAGGKVAVRFSLEVPDTLMGIAVHFTPYYNNADNEIFLLRAWADSLGYPAAELGENFQLHTPQYFTDGYDLFAFYPYDEPIPVSGNIHVGILQSSESVLNFGLDKNTNSNISRLHYQLGLGGNWIDSEIQGSVMIRPVLKANKNEMWSHVAESGDAQDAQDDIVVFPNPMEAGLGWVKTAHAGQWELFDINGRLLRSGKWEAPGTFPMNFHGLVPGVHLLKTSSGKTLRIIIQ